MKTMKKKKAWESNPIWYMVIYNRVIRLYLAEEIVVERHQGGKN